MPFVDMFLSMFFCFVRASGFRGKLSWLVFVVGSFFTSLITSCLKTTESKFQTTLATPNFWASEATMGNNLNDCKCASATFRSMAFRIPDSKSLTESDEEAVLEQTPSLTSEVWVELKFRYLLWLGDWLRPAWVLTAASFVQEIAESYYSKQLLTATSVGDASLGPASLSLEILLIKPEVSKVNTRAGDCLNLLRLNIKPETLIENKNNWCPWGRLSPV